VVVSAAAVVDSAVDVVDSAVDSVVDAVVVGVDVLVSALVAAEAVEVVVAAASTPSRERKLHSKQSISHTGGFHGIPSSNHIT